MPHKKFNIPVICIFSFAFLLFLFLVISPNFDSIAQEGGSPPVLEDFALNTNVINSDIEGELTVYVRASDSVGVSSISGELRPMAYDEETNSETQSLSLVFALALDCSGLGDAIDLGDLTGCGTAIDGIYTATVAFPYGSTLGEWKVQEIYIGGTNGYAAFGYSDLETLYGVGSATIDNIGDDEDTVGPTILDYSFDQTDIDTSAVDEVLVLTIRASDVMSGIPDSVSLDFRSPYELHNAEFSLELQVGECISIDSDIDVTGLIGCGDKNDGIFIGTATIPKWSASGDWVVENMFADNLGNVGTLPAFPVLFTNDAGTEDISGPTISSLVVDKSSFDTSQGDETITITMELVDLVSGVDIEGATIAFRRVFDWSNNAIWSSDLVLVDGDINDGTFEAEIVIPEGSSSGFWNFDGVMISDIAGNGTSFEMSTYIDEVYFANTALTDEVTIVDQWWLEGEPLISVSYNGEQKVNSIWPSITIIFEEGTVVTKQGGGDFGIHRMVSESYLREGYANLSLLLSEANSELSADIEACDISEGCVAQPLNDSNLVGSPINIGKVGLPGLGLSFSKPVTIILAVDEQYLGQTLTIQTFDGDGWVEQGTCLVRTFAPLDPAQGGNAEEWNILVSYPGCQITTDHASFFSANVLGVQTEAEDEAGVPKTGYGGSTRSLIERYLGW